MSWLGREHITAGVSKAGAGCHRACLRSNMWHVLLLADELRMACVSALLQYWWCFADVLPHMLCALLPPAVSTPPPPAPSTSTMRVPKIPAMKSLLPRSAALEALSELVPDRKLGAQVLDYWLRKRAEEEGPLLARLWFEQPWKVGGAP